MNEYAEGSYSCTLSPEQIQHFQVQWNKTDFSRSRITLEPPVDVSSLRLSKTDFSLIVLRGETESAVRPAAEYLAAAIAAAKLDALVLITQSGIDIELLPRKEAADLIRGIAMQVPDAVLVEAGLARIAR